MFKKMKQANAVFLLIVLLSSFAFYKGQKPVLYIIGDSTVKNGSGNGADDLWGWGSLIGARFDTSRISIVNKAIGGRSSRTFITEGRWEEILKTLKKGDYVLIQFGHNDSSPLDDTARARGTIRGIGEEHKGIYNPIRKINETVYTYGHYMRQFVMEAKGKGAIPIICAPIPRNNFKDGKVVRNDKDYGLWSKQVAEQTGAFFIDLNNRIAAIYDQMGSDEVNKFFPKDHTHTNKEGAAMNARLVAAGVGDLAGCRLKEYLSKTR